MKILFLFLVSANLFASGRPTHKWTFQKTPPLCAGLGLELRVDMKTQTPYVSIYKECLLGAGKRTKEKTHPKLYVKNGLVYFYNSFCGVVEADGSVQMYFKPYKSAETIHPGKYPDIDCYFDHTASFFRIGKFYLKALK